MWEIVNGVTIFGLSVGFETSACDIKFGFSVNIVNKACKFIFHPILYWCINTVLDGIMFQIDANSGAPIYRQVVDQIRRLVHSGKISAGDKLPSVRELAVKHAVNPMTVSKAYALAEAEGLLLRQRGKPMEVAVQAAPSASLSARLTELEPLLNQIVDAAEQLNLNKKQVSDRLSKLWKGKNDD
jgi:GntR family transcriptional regulator